MIRREGNDPLHFTISRRGKKLNSMNSATAHHIVNHVPNPITGSPASEVVSYRIQTNKQIQTNRLYRFQIVGTTVEGEGEEMHEGVANVLTSLGHFIQTPNEQHIKMEPEVEYDDSVIYR